MNCPNCNKLLKPTQKFCPACGTKIELPQMQEINTQAADEKPVLQYGNTAEPITEEQPVLSYGSTGEPVSVPSQPLPEEPQAPTEFDDSFNRQPPSTPQKKKNNIVIIIVLAGAALLLIAGGIFGAIKLFGSKDNDKKADKLSSSVSDTADTKPGEKSAPKGSADPEAVVKLFEKALNDNDEAAMQALVTPENREVKAKTAFAVVSALNNLTQNSLTYKCELEDLSYGVDKETADGNIKISAELPLVGTQSVSPKASFKKIDGSWYLDMITLN